MQHDNRLFKVLSFQFNLGPSHCFSYALRVVLWVVENHTASPITPIKNACWVNIESAIRITFSSKKAIISEKVMIVQSDTFIENLIFIFSTNFVISEVARWIIAYSFPFAFFPISILIVFVISRHACYLECVGYDDVNDPWNCYKFRWTISAKRPNKTWILIHE